MKTLIRFKKIEKETEKAVLISAKINGKSSIYEKNIWIPKNLVEKTLLFGEELAYYIPQWLADKKAEEIKRISNHTLFEI